MSQRSLICGVGRTHSFQWILLVFLLLIAGIPAAAQETGIQIKKPVFGGACKACPWGAMAEIVKSAMRPYGYEVQICYTCSGADAVRIVAGARIGPAPKPESDTPIPPPKGPVDFGATAVHFLWAACQGTGMYAADGPMKNLRLLANIQDPLYLMVAVRAGSGITDLRQIKEKKLPVRIIGNLDAAYSDAVLGYYGITATELESWGGRMARSNAEGRNNFDVVIHEASRGNPPEFSLFNEISETHELKYLDLPEDLLVQMARKFELERQNIPIGFLRGVDRTIPTVARSGTVIYGRADMPDDFAYAVARALDEQQDLLAWSNNTFSYNRFRVGKAFGVPLHPGASRYYQEKGYIAK
jgi:TRAP transporter TAXI family solute receptor